MFSYSVYHVLHITSILALFMTLGAYAFAGANAEPGTRKFLGILHGVAVFLVLLGGFGLAARINMLHGAFPLWLNIKLAIWLLLAGSVAFLKRKPELARVSMVLLILLGGTAAWAVSNKPGEAPIVHTTPAPVADGSAAEVAAPAAD